MRRFILLLSFVAISSFGHSTFYRTYWHPLYQSQPLNWCEQNKKHCGEVVAKKYCHKMGYPHVVKVIKANDIGQSRFIDAKQNCDNAFCDGFKMIRCGTAKLRHTEFYTHYARKRTFYYPRLNNNRVDYCYYKGKRCGQKAAYAFCRYQGYSSARHYQMQKNISSTRTLGSNELCVGHACRGFKSITCQRT